MSEERPRFVELRPNVFQIRGDTPGSHVYLIQGQRRNVLIDAGLAQNFPQLKAALEEHGLTPSDIHLIILTHEHFDHIGAAAVAFEQSILAAHRLAANKIQLQDEFVMMNKYFDLPARRFHADIWLEDGTIIDLGRYRLQVLHTPGHCSGCICLYEPSHKFLLTGDTVLADGILSDVCPSGSVSDYLNSIQKLSCLKVRRFYPGHGKISNSPTKDLQKALRDAQRLLEDSKALFEVLDTKAIFERLFRAARKFPRSGKNLSRSSSTETHK